MNDPRRSLPGVDAVLAEPGLSNVLAVLPRSIIVVAIRQAIDEIRGGLAVPDGPSSGREAAPVEAAQVAVRAAELATQLTRPTLRPVINATGVILHTNLGRAPLAAVAIERMNRSAQGYTNLEFDLETGTRGSRYSHCARLLCELTGAEAALVVNNCAAALVLALNASAQGRGVVVSRGELIEIGGGFRIPEIVERAGTHLVEVGTTNRTRLEDYREGAETQNAAALLKVHRSNFRIEGFSEEVGVAALKALADELGLPLVYDLGSGLMVPLEVPGFPPEPTVPEAVAQGADLVVFSGDKLLGGPQAGILVGSEGAVERARKNPLTRALRVDRMTLAALEATLELYRDPERARREVPTLRMIHEPARALQGRAERLAAAVEQRGGAATAGRVVAASMTSVVGGGTLPGAEVASWGLHVTPVGSPSEAARALRSGETAAAPIVARVQENMVVLDLRTVPEERDGDVELALVALLR